MGKGAPVAGGHLSVVIAGGGTGGHLYPGIAVAREVIRRVPGASVTFAGTQRGLEAAVVPREGFELDFLRSAGLKGKSMRLRLRGGVLVVPGLVDAWRIVSRRRPDVVVGVGGYSSGPVVLVAALRRVPTMVLEQNVAPGLANRLLARVVRAAAVSYESTLAFFHGRGFVAGNPVRPEFFANDGDENLGVGSRLLILGGSQGAHAINVAMVAAAPGLLRRHPGLEIVHQTGVRELDTVRKQYADLGVEVRTTAFLDPVVDEVKRATVVVCRAGATTLAELAAAGRPAVLVPLAGATDDHQRRNASMVADRGGAVLIEERALSTATLVDVVGGLIADSPRRLAMAGAIRTLARRDAAQVIVERLLTLAGWREPSASGAGRSS